MILCANPAAQFRSHQAEIEAAVLEVLRGSRHILGPQVESLEEEFADYIGTRRSVGVANGTDALELAIRALGIGPGDEVITVSHTAVATVAAIEAAGAVAVLVDVDPAYYTLDPAKLEEVLTSKTRAVIAVHIYGQPADLDAIGGFCEKHHLALIEDASQAHGARWKGKRVGGIGQIGCFSCYPTKNLGAVGDAGLVTTNDEDLARKITALREYGWKERYISAEVGVNSRLDELQAAILRVKLQVLDANNARRQAIAAAYDEALAGGRFTPPARRADCGHVFHQYVLRVEDRAALMARLRAEGVATAIHYPCPVHLQPAYRGRIALGPANCAETARAAEQVMSLPMFPELTDQQLDRICTVLRAL